MDNRVKYAELEYRNRLFNACKGILRVKQGEASGMLKTAYDLVPDDYKAIAKAVEKAQVMQANGIPLGRAEKKALEMFDRMPDMAKMKVMNAGGLNINNYQNRSVNNYGSGNIIGTATGDNARAAGGAQNNNDHNRGIQIGSGNQQNYMGGAPGGGGGYGYGYPYPYPPGYGYPPTGGDGVGWGWGPNGWGYYGPDGKPTTPPTEGESEAKTEASKPGAGVRYTFSADGQTVLIRRDDGTTERIPADEFKARFRLGGPEEPKALPAPEAGAEEGAKPKPDGPVDKDGIQTVNNHDGTFTRTYPDGHTETIDGTGKVVSTTDATGTKVTEPGKETVITPKPTADPNKDITTTETTGGEGTGGPTDADYAAMHRTDHRHKFINDFVDRKTDEFNKRWNGAGIASGLAGAATMGTGGYHAGNALAKHLGWVDDKGNDTGWGAKALRWGGALLGAGFGGATGYYGAKSIDRARRQKGYREIGGRAYDKVVKPVVKDMDPAKISTASYTNTLVKKLRNQVGYRYYNK